MTVTDRLLSVLVLAALLVGCPSAVEVPEASTGSATSTGSSSSATTSTATPTTSTTQTTGVETGTGTTTMAPPSFCDLCGDQQICVEFLDEHTCGQPVDDGTRLVCLENPNGCVPSDPCSVACQDLCGAMYCEAPVECAKEPGAMTCSTSQGQTGSTCDPFIQNCVEGKKCVPYGDSGFQGTKCVPVVEPAAGVGEACEGPDADGGDNCELGAVCFAGECVALCIGSPDAPDCADPAQTCSISGAFTSCFQRCDPLAPTCAADEVCVWLAGGENEFACVVDASMDGGQALTPCEYVNGCDPGLVCVEAVSLTCPGACCTPICDLMGPAVCPEPDQVCVPYYVPGAAPPGYEAVGYCGISM